MDSDMEHPLRLYETKLGQETYFASWYLLWLFVFHGFDDLGYVDTWSTIWLWIAVLALFLSPMLYIIRGENTPFDQRSFVTLGMQWGAASVALLVGAVVLSPAVTVVEAVLATSLLAGGLLFILAGKSSRPNLLAWRTFAAAGYGSIGAGLLVAWAGIGLGGATVLAGATGVVAAAVNWWIALELLRDSDRYSIEPRSGARPAKSPIEKPATDRT